MSGVAAVVLAGGSGTRMGADRNKVLLTLRGELFAGDGAEHVAGDVTGIDGEVLARDLAAALLERAPPAVRSGFGG